MLVLSGCAGESDTKGADDPNKSVAPPTISVDNGDSGTAIIRGAVINDETLPIAGVRVGLLAAHLLETPTVTTDESGGFGFEGISAGTYTVLAQKFGYRDAQVQNIQVADGETREETIILKPLPSATPHTHIVPKAGFISAYGYKIGDAESNGILPPPVFENKNFNNWKTDDRPENMQAVVSEVTWQGTQALTGNLVFIVSVGDFGAFDKPELTFVRVEAGNPIREVTTHERIQEILGQGNSECRIDEEADESACKFQTIVWPGTGNTGLDMLDLSVAVEQPYEQAVSVFFRMEPDPTYTYF